MKEEIRKNHDKEISGIFCSLCGSKIEMREVTNTIIKEVNPWSLNEEFGDEDMFYPCNGNYKILLPNRKRKHYISVDRDTREGNYQVPDSNDAIRELYQNHNDYLEFLTNKGIKWSVDFGLINYWS
jgi:hypothetical protein